MSEGQSQRSVVSSVQHQQEAEVAAAEEREREAAETAAARAARLAMAELAAARVDLCASSTGSSVSADDDRDNEFKLARGAAQEKAAQWVAAHP
jgi:hypothetical protein